MKKSFLILLLPLLLSGCGEEQEEQHSPAPGPNIPVEPEPKPEPEPDPEPSPAPSGTYTTTVKLSGSDFASFAIASGKQIDNSEHTGEKAQLLEFLRSKVEYETMVSEISCIKLNTAEWDGGAALCIGTGYYANNKFLPGTFKWSSDVKIYNVELKARAYTKKNDYSGDIIDTPAHVQLDGDDLELMPSGATTPEIKTISKAYPTGADCFTVTSTGARVVVQELTITWKA